MDRVPGVGGAGGGSEKDAVVAGDSYGYYGGRMRNGRKRRTGRDGNHHVMHDGWGISTRRRKDCKRYQEEQCRRRHQFVQRVVWKRGYGKSLERGRLKILIPSPPGKNVGGVEERVSAGNGRTADGLLALRFFEAPSSELNAFILLQSSLAPACLPASYAFNRTRTQS